MNEEHNIFYNNIPNETDNHTEPSEKITSTPTTYRYRYEHGEKTEVTNEPYETYHSQTQKEYTTNTQSYDAYDYNNTTSFYTTIEPEATPKKKKFKFGKGLKWTAKAACFGLIAGVAFFGVNYLGTKATGVPSFTNTMNSTQSTGGTGTPLNITLGKTNVIEGAQNLSETVVEQVVEEKMLVEVLNRFLRELPKEKRMIFLRRYWYMSSIKEIAKDYELSEGKVKMTLFRIRNKLKQVLEKEGIYL